jgi:hypothetical protein
MWLLLWLRHTMTSTTIEGAKLFRAFRVFRGQAFVSDLEPVILFQRTLKPHPVPVR